ncbi:MAG: Ig-like domain-containing domain [Planctomycetota bacterium]|jgi:hypothetical protein
MFTFTRKALVAAMVLSLGATVGCRENQRSTSSATDDFKDLVLLQVNPPDGVTNVFRDTDIVLEFTAPVDPASVNGTTVQIRDAGGGTPIGGFIVENERVIFRPLNPPALLANTTYTIFLPTWPAAVTLMSIEQTPLMGVAQTVRNPSSFTTGAQIRPDTTCPFVVSVNPPQNVTTDPFITTGYGATNVPTNANISVRFSEPIATSFNALGPGPVIDPNITYNLPTPPGGTLSGAGGNFYFRLVNVNGATPGAFTTGTLVLKDNGRLLEFDPNTTFDATITQTNGYLEPNTQYRIDLVSDSAAGVGIRDGAGNFLASDALCNVPASFNPSGTPPTWNGTFSYTFTTAATAATPTNGQVVEDLVDNVTEQIDPTAYDTVTDAGTVNTIDPMQATPTTAFATQYQMEWNSAIAGGATTGITQSGNTTLSPNPGMVSYQPGVGGGTTPGLLWTGTPPPTSKPPFDNNLTGGQLGWRIQFIILKAEIDGSAGTGAANVGPNTDAINGGLLTRLFLREDNTNGNIGPHTYNNLIVRLSHTDQTAFGAVFDPDPNLAANTVTFRSNHSLGGVLNQPTTVARISSYTTPPANGIGWFEIPIAPNFVWDGTNHIVVDIECRGGTGVIDLAGIQQTAGTNRFFYGDIQNPNSNASGVGGVMGLPTDELPSVGFVFDTWTSAVPAVRTGAAPNGFTKPLGWPNTVERGVYDPATGLVASYPTNAAINPDFSATARTGQFVPFTNPPEDVVVRSGLNISTDASPAFGNFLFRTFEVQTGAVVNITGTNPCIIRATHTVKIDGIINADGRSGQSGTTAGGAGGAGGPGGGQGGGGGNGATAGAGSAGSAGIGYDFYNPGVTAQTNPNTTPGVTPPGWGSGGGGTGGQGGASGGGAGYATAGTAGPAVGASPGGDAGVAWGSANIIFLSGGTGGGGGGGGVSTTGAGGGGGGGGGGYLQIISDRNVVIAGNAVITSRGGNGGTVQGATPGGGGGGGSGGAIVIQGTTVTFTRLGAEPGAVIDTAADLVGPLTFGQGGASPAAGAGGNGGDGRIRIDSLLSTGAAPGQATATFTPAPVVRDASSQAWLLLPRQIRNVSSPGANAPTWADASITRTSSLWFDTGTGDPSYQSVTVQYSFPLAVQSNGGSLTVWVETCDTDLFGTPDVNTWLQEQITLTAGSPSTTLSPLPNLIPAAPFQANTGRLVRITATARAGTNGQTPELQRVQINYQY